MGISIYKTTTTTRGTITMEKSIIEMVVGSLDEKREYNQLMKRVRALPKEYAYTFKKIQSYMYNVDLENYGMTIFSDLIELFEDCVANQKPILDVVGNDVATFCDELILANKQTGKSARDNLNQEIYDYFHKENN